MPDLPAPTPPPPVPPTPLHQRVAAALDAAVDRSGPALIDFIRATYPCDPELIAEIEDLFAEHRPGPLDLAPLIPGGIPNLALAARSAAEAAFTAPASNVTSPPFPTSIGPYSILREVGRGGMGIVYEARQREPSRRVAIKVVSALSPAAGARLRGEAAAMGRLKHPGIAQIYEAAVDPAAGPYIAMEFVDGQTLLDFAATRRLSLPERVSLLASVADAVHAAHQRGIIHRDLKPSNVLVELLPDGSPCPKILDFGVAQLITTDETHTITLAARSADAARIVGTIGYMSPEQLDPPSEGLDIRADVYALGVLLYELLTGRQPIDLAGAGLTEAARRVLAVEPTPLDRLVDGVRGDLSIIAATAVVKDRRLRYSSAAALASDLRRFLAHEPIAARPPTVIYQLRKLARRHRGLTAGVLSGLFALLLGTVVATFFAISENRQRLLAESALALAERRVYTATLAAAARASIQADAAAAQDSLTQAPQPLRGWEWSYLASKTDGAFARAPAADGSAMVVGATAAGHLVVVYTSTLALVEPDSWRLIASIPVDAPPRQFSVAPSGDLIAYWSSGTLRVMNANDLLPLWTRADVPRLDRSAFSSGSLIALPSPDNARIFLLDARTGTPRADFPAAASPTGGVLFASSPDVFYEVSFGQRLVARRTDSGTQLWTSSLAGLWRSSHSFEAPILFDDRSVSLISPSTGELTRRFEIDRGPVSASGFPDAGLIAIADRLGAIAVHNAFTGERISLLLGHTRGTESVFLPSGTLASGSHDGSLRLWNPSSLASRSITPGPERTTVARLAPAAGRVVAAGWGSVFGWNLASGTPEYTTFIDRSRGPSLIALAPDGLSAFVTGWRDGPVIIDTRSGSVRRSFPSLARPWSLAHWTPSGILLVAPDQSVTLLDPTSAAATTIDLPVPSAIADGLYGEVLLGTPAGQIFSYSGATPPTPLLAAHDQRITALSAAPSGLVASTDTSGVVIIQSTSTATPVRARVPGSPTALAFTPDSSRLAVCTPGTVHIINTNTGDLVLSLQGPAQSLDASFSTDSTSLAIAGSPPLTIYSLTKSDPAALDWLLTQSGTAAATRAFAAAPRQTADDARDRLHADTTLPSRVRDAALRAIDIWREPVPVLNSECWAVAVSPSAPIADAHRAVRAMRAIVLANPSHHHLVNTLAFCLYRAEQFDEALTTFERSDSMGIAAGTPEPTDAAGTAMTLWRLGKPDQARQWLATAHRRAGSSADPILREAQHMIAPPLTSP